MPLGGINYHGQFQSRVLLRRRYQSVQASINPVTLKYRRAGQVTGLLFRSGDDPNHPDVLGQWTGPGAVYDLDEDEQIVDLELTTAKPTCRQRARPGLLQIVGVTLVTNLRRLNWGPRTTDVCGRKEEDHIITEVSWEFNAIFDRVICSYI
jgi:hypothetical protein